MSDKLFEIAESIRTGSRTRYSGTLTEDDVQFICAVADASECFEHLRLEYPVKVAKLYVRLRSVIHKHSNESRRKAVAESLEGAVAVRFKSKNLQLILHRSTRKDAESDWQLTTLDADGRPLGHNNPPSLLEGAYRALGISTDGYWNEHGYKIVEVSFA